MTLTAKDLMRDDIKLGNFDPDSVTAWMLLSESVLARDWLAPEESVWDREFSESTPNRTKPLD
jgi:hypothetical protein